MNSNEKNIAKQSKSSFYYAFNLLGKERSEAMNIVYAFCRMTDDIVDNEEYTVEVKSANLNNWKDSFNKAMNNEFDSDLFSNLKRVIDRFKIPKEPFLDLIRGMRMDLEKNRIKSFDELEEYCYCAASTVGLMSIEIFGYKHESAKQYAVNLGKALQLTNILRDVKTDSKINRIYLPDEDLKKFNYSEEELFNGVYNNNFFELMKFESVRAQNYFEQAKKDLHLLDKKNMFAAQAMRHIYYRLFNELKNKKFDIFNNEIKVKKSDKLLIALFTWLKYSLMY